MACAAGKAILYGDNIFNAMRRPILSPQSPVPSPQPLSSMLRDKLKSCAPSRSNCTKAR
jgi:hypothetical protein